VVLMLARDKAAAQGAASNASQLADADQSEIWAREAEKEYQAGAVELAIRLELRAMMLKPDDPRLAWTAGTWWLEVNEPARAVQLLMGALNNPRYVLGEPDLIQVYQTEGLTFEKRREIRYSIAVTLAEAFRALGSTRDEIEMLREAIAARPAKPVYVRLADLLLAQGRPQEATEALRQAALLDPDDFEISARLARAYAASGDASAALRYGVRAFNANPTDAQTALLVAEIYARSGDLTAAMQILGDAMKATAGHPELEAANARLRQGLDLR
jgi:tetratricopeptide (TPR) repeat protein